MKKFSDGVKDFIRHIPDEDLRFLQSRFSQRIGSDLADAIELLQNNEDVDRFLSNAPTNDEFWEAVDSIDYLVQQEARKRHGSSSFQEKK